MNFLKKSPEVPNISREMEWAISRIVKSSDGNVQYSRFSSPEYREMECPACGRLDRKEHSLTSESVQYFVCHCCGTHIAQPAPQNHHQRIDSIQVKCEIYRDTDIVSLTTDALACLRPYNGGRFLDVNCGLGFTVDAVRHQPGWEATGITSSDMALAAKAWLNSDVLTGTIGALPNRDNRGYDVVFCHSLFTQTASPLELLNKLVALLEPQGTLFMDAPLVDAVYELNNNSTVRLIIGPNKQAIVPTVDGIKLLFKRAGLNQPRIVRSGLSLKIIYGQNAGVVEAHTKTENAGLSYLSAWCEPGPECFPFKEAAAARLFIRTVNTGNWSAVPSARDTLMPFLETAPKTVQRFEAAKSRSSALKIAFPTASRVLLCEGMYCLNSAVDIKRAREMYALASRLGRATYKLSSALFPDEQELADCADYHEVLALLRLGDTKTALELREAGTRRIQSSYWLNQLSALKI